uniref:inositol-phosphate phosphatase n=1 Tax=Timema shepardi TaxID=629360 RepID=A0A7R9FZC7_TIMSH|nr:unnamed protein product [Timema shepardi]
MEITASLAHLEIKRAQEEGVLCPSNLLHGLFVIGAYDNMDHNYSSTTSESYYHGKAISIFQIPGEGEVGEPRNFATSISCVDQSNRKVTELPDSYNVVKTVTLPPKKPPVPIASEITCSQIIPGRTSLGSCLLSDRQRSRTRRMGMYQSCRGVGAGLVFSALDLGSLSHYSTSSLSLEQMKTTNADQTPHRRRVKGSLLSPLACEGCSSTLRNYSDGSAFDHVIANSAIKVIVQTFISQVPTLIAISSNGANSARVALVGGGTSSREAETTTRCDDELDFTEIVGFVTCLYGDFWWLACVLDSFEDKQEFKLIKERIWGPKLVVEKSCEVDLVTETDQQIEKLLISSLQKHFPDHKFIGEESVADGAKCELTASPTWIIDPVDGTMNFVHGYPNVCVSVALWVDKESQLAIVYNPVLEQLFTARRGKGAFLNGSRIHASKETGALLVEEAGGVILDTTGGKFDVLSRRYLCAGTQTVADQLVKIMKQFSPDRD